MTLKVGQMLYYMWWIFPPSF